MCENILQDVSTLSNMDFVQNQNKIKQEFI